MAQGWTTYFGGYGDLAQSGNDINDRIFSATITDGSLFIVGSSGAYSPKLPVQDPGGGAYYQPELSGDIGVDGFIAKLDLDGNSITNLKDEELIGNQIKVFPNPFKESIEVIVMNESHFQYDYRVYDLSGKLMFSGEFNQARFNIPLSSIPKGLYFLEVRSTEGIAIKRIVKQ